MEHDLYKIPLMLRNINIKDIFPYMLKLRHKDYLSS